ncbi:bifunctional phosphopantothenoylcysteine decarboxylase/phosphopantothenate--cysteine ligase CoaBC [Saprospiraceae bacterium]|nr:bifunctional phosphopantothenoylcysteine decarboxylase/phosphopantothenate--cysteine ligase CoaBC [Saprospiraceae bacterium]
MNGLKGKKILLAVTGSIAAYKSLILTRQIIKAGAEVRVIMTKASCSFVSPLSFATLSKHEVFTDVSSESSWNNHVELGLWADLMIIAPCTATTLAKLANGIADSMVVACYLSAKCPVFFAPAMDLDMWIHPSTTMNIEKLQSYGNHLITVGAGELASGLVGEGRMEEPENIVSILSNFIGDLKNDLEGKRVLITAGPTYEDLDPVRYIGNRSTGKMGVALAEVCAERGAEVKLVLGPSKVVCSEQLVEVVKVRSADQMLQAVVDEYKSADIVIFAAAVADYRPVIRSEQKIKKKVGEMSIALERTPDIAATTGKMKSKNQFHVGFALETQNEEQNAKSKLKRKNFDMIVLNSLQDPGAGFGHDTNKIKIFDSDGNFESFPLQSKKNTARDIIDAIVKRFIVE